MSETKTQPGWHLVEDRWYCIAVTDIGVYVNGELASRYDGQCVGVSVCLPEKIVRIIYEETRGE